MSIKSKVLATAATLALVGGVGTAGVLGTAATANAATPSCGGTCVDIFSQEFGHHSVPELHPGRLPAAHPDRPADHPVPVQQQ